MEREGLVNGYESRLSSSEQLFNEKLLDLEVNLSKSFGAESQRLVAERNELRERVEASDREARAKIGALEADLGGTLEALRNAEKLLEELGASYEALNVEKDKFDQVKLDL